MRLFELQNIQDLVLFLFPALAFIVLFAIGLSFAYIAWNDSDERHVKITERFPGGIEERNAPFPLILYIVIFGTIAWALLYIFFYGYLGVKI
ncbi:MAG: hypothetical protein C4530_12490 [Desulfobacteraceae bacterium]|nr:MAG: hypothetical protein C4530_12490 [Desulfobacteraceae bacterium]